MFAVNRHLWVRWGIEDGEVRFDCRYYKERLGRVEETGGTDFEDDEGVRGGASVEGRPEVACRVPGDQVR